MSLIRILVIGGFATWLILTVQVQFDCRMTRIIRSFDLLHLLPRWTFFAPNPGTSDYHLVFRVMDAAGTVSPFEEIYLQNRNHALEAIWNPRKRVHKCMVDLAMDLSRLTSLPEINDNNVQLTLSYVGLLNFLRGAARPPGTKLVQYALLKSEGFSDKEMPQVIIVSAFHDA